MHSRIGNVLYWAGSVGAGISIGYALDAILLHQTGSSPLPTSGNFMSRDDTITAVLIGVVLALLSWGAGTVARSVLSKPAKKKTAPEDAPY